MRTTYFSLFIEVPLLLELELKTCLWTTGCLLRFRRLNQQFSNYDPWITGSACCSPFIQLLNHIRMAKNTLNTFLISHIAWWQLVFQEHSIIMNRRRWSLVDNIFIDLWFVNWKCLRLPNINSFWRGINGTKW